MSVLRPENIFPDRVLERVVHCKRDDYNVLVDRSTEWGNPFVLDNFDGRIECLRRYLQWLSCRVTTKWDPMHFDDYRRPQHIREWAADELGGKVLGCWCAPKLCHAHVLAALSMADDPLEAVYWILGELR